MRTKEEILIDNLMSVNDSINAITELGIVENIKSAMEEYAQQQVKSVDLADVGGSEERAELAHCKSCGENPYTGAKCDNTDCTWFGG